MVNLIICKSDDYIVKHFCDEKIMTWYDFAEQILKENKLLTKSNFAIAKNYRTFAKRPKKTILN